jgi:hypothetical protein
VRKASLPVFMKYRHTPFSRFREEHLAFADQLRKLYLLRTEWHGCDR